VRRRSRAAAASREGGRAGGGTGGAGRGRAGPSQVTPRTGAGPRREGRGVRERGLRPIKGRPWRSRVPAAPRPRGAGAVSALRHLMRLIHSVLPGFARGGRTDLCAGISHHRVRLPPPTLPLAPVYPALLSSPARASTSTDLSAPGDLPSSSSPAQ
jgi:hypothetical protein